MFNLVLVDDKKDVVQGISAALNWEAKGVSIHSFYNGADALAYCLENPPHMVITDICMPLMSGLDLAKAVLQVHKKVRFIILTGYDDFSYARAALRLGVVEYLSKPVRIETIEQLVDKEVLLAKNSVTENYNRVEMWRKYRRSLPSLKSKLLQDLLNAKEELSQEKIQERFTELEIPLSQENVVAAIIEIDSILGAEEDRDVLFYAVENISKEVLSEQYICDSFRCGENRIVFLLNYQPQDNSILTYYQLYNLFSTIQTHCRNLLENTVSVGVGGCQKSLSEVALSYNQACFALEQKYFKGNQALVTHLDLQISENSKAEHTYLLLQQQIDASLQKKDIETLKLQLQKLFDELKKPGQQEPVKIREYLLNLALQLCKEKAIAEKFSCIEILEEFKKQATLQETQEWFFALISYFLAETEKQKNDMTQNILKVKNYIFAHYGENISLKTMADYIYISPTYLSFSFKDILGVNFSDYLASVRIEKAKELLETTDYKVYEVCTLVGYKDKKYFSDLFKRYTGFLPKEWKRKDRENE
ncbi:MAG: response regulator [Oscillospiraceae bacterium]|nr:response regulator [Oscillospiraceae bacterium]